MKKCLVLAALIAALSVLQAAAADDSGKTKPEKKASLEAKTEIGGMEIRVGPEGRFEVKALDGSTLHAGELRLGNRQGEPEQKSRKGGSIEVGEGVLVISGSDREKKGSPELKLERTFGKAIMIGPEGKIEVKDFGSALPKELLEKLPGELRERMSKESRKDASFGKIKVTVEIDGQRKEFESELNAPAANKTYSTIQIFEDAVKKHGNELPSEVKRSLEAATRAMTKAPSYTQPVPGSNVLEFSTRPAPGSNVLSLSNVNTGDRSRDIGAKLDKILERLERLEKDVKALKAKEEE
jgi:hypothetical protein